MTRKNIAVIRVFRFFRGWANLWQRFVVLGRQDRTDARRCGRSSGADRPLLALRKRLPGARGHAAATRVYLMSARMVRVTALGQLTPVYAGLS